jgi:hypothetical protein
MIHARPACAVRRTEDRVEGAVAVPRDRHGRSERGEEVQPSFTGGDRARSRASSMAFCSGLLL